MCCPCVVTGQLSEKCRTLLTHLHLFTKQSEEIKIWGNFCIIKRYFAEGCFFNLLKVCVCVCVCVHMCVCAHVRVCMRGSIHCQEYFRALKCAVRARGVELEDTYMKHCPHKIFFGAVL